jgi:hypothetical protein
MIRKLAREAVIFALLGFFIVSIALLVPTQLGVVTSAKRSAATAVHDVSALSESEPHKPLYLVNVPLTNGTVLRIRKCADGNKSETRQDAFNSAIERRDNCRYFDNEMAKFGGVLDSIPLGHAEQIAVEHDYWAAYQGAMHRDVFSSVAASLLLGLLWGFCGGTALWIFYRLIRFAVTG